MARVRAGGDALWLPLLRNPLPPTPSPTLAPTPTATLPPPPKAVLVIGPADDLGEDFTAYQVRMMDAAAAELELYGFTVQKFYTPNDDWSGIAAAAAGATVFAYTGHGVYLTPFPQPDVGGLNLTEGIITPDRMRAELALAPNALVFLYGACFSAGGSSLPGDEVDQAEARRRVAQYAAPFFEGGAAGYYAGCPPASVLRRLYAGRTLRSSFENVAWGDVYPGAHPYYSGYDLYLSSGFWQAYVGRGEATLDDLWPSATGGRQ
jgi:hypothetical protein